MIYDVDLFCSNAKYILLAIKNFIPFEKKLLSIKVILSAELNGTKNHKNRYLF